MQASTSDSLSVATKRAVVALAAHAVAVVVDQVDGREPGEAEEDKFLEVTEPLADVTIDALNWNVRAAEAETLCTALVEFLRWGQAYFSRRESLQEIKNMYSLRRCESRMSRGRFDGAESDARSVLNNCNYTPLPHTLCRNGSTSGMPFAARPSVRISQRIGSVDSTEWERRSHCRPRCSLGRVT